MDVYHYLKFILLKFLCLYLDGPVLIWLEATVLPKLPNLEP